ncbi:glycosyl transferase [Gallibacterium salpingitidis]|uniref:stealth family protein n=1 Tax=Gallibacterium salpingitidis TaxID=505341 RepID=UPI000804B19B|nr:stealth family protein [Gallibacterium salpingitidis]OBX06567.1 glycosyl transferase [Gallibacterium salpingitidis]
MYNGDEKIDFVLPWVDPSDVEWQKRKEYFKNGGMVDVQSNSNARYRDMETLRYVLRSIEKNCSWYNKIILITEGHYPKWLNINHHKIKLITHEELYFDKKHLPTFNCSSIECNLPNLRTLGVSKKFIYLNDDTIIYRNVDITRFFIKNLPVDFLCHTFIPRSQLLLRLMKVSDSWPYSLLHNINLINMKANILSLTYKQIYNSSYCLYDKVNNFIMKNIYRKAISLQHWHHPQPYLMSTLEAVYENFQKEISLASMNRFRDKSDLTQYIYRYWHLLNGEFYPMKYDDGIGDKNIAGLDDLTQIFKELENDKNLKFVCFNDSPELSDEDFYLVKKELITKLEDLFPEKASFEL